MDRIIGIDYGRKRIGVAVSDPLRIFASALETVQSANIIEYLQKYAEDERFTSVLAHRAMIDGGMKASERRDKASVDKISATIILQSYLDRTGSSTSNGMSFETLNCPIPETLSRNVSGKKKRRR